MFRTLLKLILALIACILAIGLEPANAKTLSSPVLSDELRKILLNDAFEELDATQAGGKRPGGVRPKAPKSKKVAPKKVKKKAPLGKKKLAPGKKKTSKQKQYKKAPYKKIKLDQKGIKHIKDRHLNKSLAREKSQFKDMATARRAIQMAHQKPYTVSRNGHHVRTFSMGKKTHVGNVAGSGKATNMVTVVTSRNGRVVTAHPGAPN